eukprot:746001-Hanusia_phi.AAC.8
MGIDADDRLLVHVISGNAILYSRHGKTMMDAGPGDILGESRFFQINSSGSTASIIAREEVYPSHLPPSPRYLPHHAVRAGSNALLHPAHLRCEILSGACPDVRQETATLPEDRAAVEHHGETRECGEQDFVPGEEAVACAQEGALYKGGGQGERDLVEFEALEAETFLDILVAQLAS